MSQQTSEACTRHEREPQGGRRRPGFDDRGEEASPSEVLLQGPVRFRGHRPVPAARSAQGGALGSGRRGHAGEAFGFLKGVHQNHPDVLGEIVKTIARAWATPDATPEHVIDRLAIDAPDTAKLVRATLPDEPVR